MGNKLIQTIKDWFRVNREEEVPKEEYYPVIEHSEVPIKKTIKHRPAKPHTKQKRK